MSKKTSKFCSLLLITIQLILLSNAYAGTECLLRIISEEIRTKEKIILLKKVISSKQPFENSDIYKYLSLDLNRTEEILNRMYGDRNEIVKQTKEVLGIKFIPLLIDPGIANRGKEFISFSLKYLSNHSSSSIPELRKAFSEHLGKRKLFRGMVLYSKEMKNITRSGMLAPGMLSKSKDHRILRLFATDDELKRLDETSLKTLPKSIGDEIGARLTNYYKKSESMLMSASAHKEIASSVGYHSSGKPIKKRIGNLYLFEIEVPEISVLDYSGDIYSSWNMRPLVKINNKIFDGEKGRAIEVFIPHFIAPENIISVEKYIGKVPKYLIRNRNRP